MKSPLRFSLLFLLMLSGFSTLNAQTTAGIVPFGAILQTPSIQLLVDSTHETQTGLLDVDCDGQDDFAFIIDYGFNAGDAPTTADVRPLHNTAELCGQYVFGYVRPQATQHLSGEPLLCTGTESFITDTLLTLGFHGGLGAQLPYAATDMYLAFRVGNQVGWIKLSYNVDLGEGPAFMNVDEVTAYCATFGVGDKNDLAALEVYPNPSRAGFTVDFGQPISDVSLNLINLLGESVMVKRYGVAETIALSAELPKGVYLLEVSDRNGGRVVRRLIRD